MTQILAPDIETSSENYAQRFSGATGEYFLDVQNRLVSKLLNRVSPGPLRILEVGGGHAQLTPMLLDNHHDVTVHGSADSCRERISVLEQRRSTSIPFISSPIPGVIAVPDKSFDVVIAIRLLAHIDDRPSFLDELMRIAKRGVIVDYAPLFGWNALTPLLYTLKKRIEGNTRDYICQSDGAVRDAFLRGGFTVEKISKQFALPMAIHRGIQRRELSEMIEKLSGTIGLTRLIGSPGLILATCRDS